MFHPTIKIHVSRIDEYLGTIYARDFETAMLMIQHPLTISGNYDMMDKYVSMKEELNSGGHTRYIASSRRMVFDIETC